MECNDVKEAIIDFITGEVSQEQKDLVLQHIATCRRCRDELSELVNIEEGLRHVFKINSVKYPIPLNVLENIKQQITKDKQPLAPKQGITASILIITQSLSSIRLFPIRLSWKTGLASILVFCLVVILAILLPIIFDQSPEVLAVNIALNNPQLQAILFDKGVDYRETTNTYVFFYEDRANVVFDFGPDLLAIAEVDLGKKEMIQLYTLELTNEKKQEIVDIARTDSRVQSLLEQGAYINGFYPLYAIGHKESIGPGGEIHNESYIEFTVNMRIQLGEKEYVAFIDLSKNEVTSLLLSN